MIATVVWAIVGVVLLLSEFFIPGFVVFFFGIGALLNAFFVAIIPEFLARVPLQLAAWAVTSSASLILLRRYVSRVFRGTVLDNAGGREFVGRQAEVAEEISPDAPGRVRFQGTTWTAVTYDETLEVGARVDILEKEGTRLTVTRSFLE